MISWKYSFEKISKDLELARKKKEALDGLFNSGKISASTYESLDKELTDAILEIEARKKDLTEKMASQIAGLEKQISTLELFLANSEIRYAAGEIDEDRHANEIGAFTLGLDALKRQLSAIKEVVAELMPEVVAPTLPPTPSEVEEAQLTEEAVEGIPQITAETPIEMPVETPTEVEPISEEVTIEEPLEATEEVVAEEVTIEEPLKTPEETPTEEGVEAPLETPAEETPVEEEAPSKEEVSEETAEETVATEEVVAETYTEETATEEEIETEASAEEASSYEEAEAATEETYE